MHAQDVIGTHSEKRAHKLCVYMYVWWLVALGQGGCNKGHAFQEEAFDLTLSLQGQGGRKGISSAENTFCGRGKECHAADGS